MDIILDSLAWKVDSRVITYFKVHMIGIVIKRYISKIKIILDIPSCAARNLFFLLKDL